MSHAVGSEAVRQPQVLEPDVAVVCGQRPAVVAVARAWIEARVEQHVVSHEARAMGRAGPVTGAVQVVLERRRREVVRERLAERRRQRRIRIAAAAAVGLGVEREADPCVGRRDDLVVVLVEDRSTEPGLAFRGDLEELRDACRRVRRGKIGVVGSLSPSGTDRPV